MYKSRFVLFSCCALLCFGYVLAKECGDNEILSDCFQAVCRHQECIVKGAPIGCPGLAAGSCKEACICKEGYLRDDSGKCIPEEDCLPNPCANADVQDLSNCTTAICRQGQCPESECAPTWQCITSRYPIVGDLIMFKNVNGLIDGTPGRVTNVYPDSNGAPPEVEVTSQWGIQKYHSYKTAILWSCQSNINGVETRQC